MITSLSFDKKQLNIGDKVYQIAFRKPNGMPEILEYEILDILENGSIKILTQSQVNDSELQKIVTERHTVRPENVHSDPIELIHMWTLSLSRKLLEIPKQIERLESIKQSIKNNEYFIPLKINSELENIEI